MSTYTTSLGLEEITPGDQAGLWGNTTNNNLELIDQAVTGVTPISFTGLSGTVRVLDSANGAIDEARAAVLNITGNATGPNTVVVPNKQKTYLVRNFTGQTVGYGGGKYIVKYYTLASSTTSFTVTFSSSVKVSRFMIGNYWSPKYNTNFGVQVGYEDATTSERLQSGDLYTTIAPRNKTLQFDLQYMDESDKFQLFDIYRSIGKTKPVFVSVFPEDLDKQKEQMYSIYGKFNTLSNISYIMYSIYSSSLQLEEI
jgi:hypothetical protein